MRHAVGFLVRLALFALIVWMFTWAASATLPGGVNLGVIAGAVLLTYPVVQLGRAVLDRHPTPAWAAWTTTAIHGALGVTFGLPIVRALVTHGQWPGWVLPIPTGIGWALVVVTLAACAIVVANLALKGLGAPFFLQLSRKLAVDWLYAWTRNPMVLTAIAFFVALGIWFQSTLFVLWVLVEFTPALLFFIKVFEERELELRFGASYQAYRARTPMLIPRKPRG